MLARGEDDDDRGSSPVEFVLVGALLTILTLAVLQLAVGVYVTNVVHDAAVEGAYYAALADTTAEEGVERTRLVIIRSVGESFAEEVTATEQDAGGQRVIEVQVRSTLPLIGLLGVSQALEVSARAPVETLGEE